MVTDGEPTSGGVAMLLNVLNLVALFILVIITGWYAYSTRKMLGEMKAQAHAVREQSLLLSKSAQIVAKSAQIAGWDRITKAASAAGLPAASPLTKLSQLVTQLGELDAELDSQSKASRPEI